MHSEITAAAQWVEKASFAAGLGTALESVLSARFEGHWYPAEPDRGAAFRSLEVNAHRMDKPLVQACAQAGLDATQVQYALCAQQTPGSTLRIWINPNEVKAAVASGVQRIYGDASNPYLLRLKIERTIIQINSDDSDSAGDSTGPSSPIAVSSAMASSASMPTLELSSAGTAPAPPAASRAASFAVLDHIDQDASWQPAPARELLARSSSLSASAASFEFVPASRSSSLSAAAVTFEPIYNMVPARWSIGAY